MANGVYRGATIYNVYLWKLCISETKGDNRKSADFDVVSVEVIFEKTMTNFVSFKRCVVLATRTFLESKF